MRVLAPLDAGRIHESEEKEGGTQTREQRSPSLVRGSLIKQRERNVMRQSVKCRCSLLSAISLRSIGRRSCAARVAVGAAVSSSEETSGA